MYSVKYVSNNGMTIDLMSEYVSIDEIEKLFNSEWSYNSKTTFSNGGKITRFYKGCAEKNVSLDILADNEQQYNQIMKDLHDAFDYDVRILVPGKLWVNGSYLKCYIYATDYSDYDELMCSITKDIKIVSEYPFFVKEMCKENFSSVGIVPNEVGLAVVGHSRVYGDGSGYLLDSTLDGDTNMNRFINDNYCGSDFEMVINGFVENPYITINDYIYNVNVKVQDGSKLVINSREKKMYIINEDGTRENVFSKRNKEYDAFRKIDPGENIVLFLGEFSFSLTVFAERNEASWT